MSTHFQKLLRDQADNPLFSGQGDGIKDGRYYLVNGFDGFLTSAAKAIAADGLDRQTLMKLFVNHALEVLNRHSAYLGIILIFLGLSFSNFVKPIVKSLKNGLLSL